MEGARERERESTTPVFYIFSFLSLNGRRAERSRATSIQRRCSPNRDRIAYTFLDFNNQGDSDFDFLEFRSPVCWPTPSDSRPTSSALDHRPPFLIVTSTPTSRPPPRGLDGRSGNQGDDDGFESYNRDFMLHSCNYCGVSNHACLVNALNGFII